MFIIQALKIRQLKEFWKFFWKSKAPNCQVTFENRQNIKNTLQKLLVFIIAFPVIKLERVWGTQIKKEK